MAGVLGIAVSTMYSIQGHCMNLQGTQSSSTPTVWKHTKGWNVECSNNTIQHNTTQHNKMNNIPSTYYVQVLITLSAEFTRFTRVDWARVVACWRLDGPHL